MCNWVVLDWKSESVIFYFQIWIGYEVHEKLSGWIRIANFPYSYTTSTGICCWLQSTRLSSTWPCGVDITGYLDTHTAKQYSKFRKFIKKEQANPQKCNKIIHGWMIFLIWKEYHWLTSLNAYGSPSTPAPMKDINILPNTLIVLLVPLEEPCILCYLIFTTKFSNNWFTTLGKSNQQNEWKQPPAMSKWFLSYLCLNY